MAYAYQKIIDDFLRRISTGELRPGDKLPTLDALEKTYPQSRMTLYRALRHLTEQGYLAMTPGRGTFVRPIQPRKRIGILTGPNVFDHGVVPFALTLTLTALAQVKLRGRASCCALLAAHWSAWVGVKVNTTAAWPFAGTFTEVGAAAKDTGRLTLPMFPVLMLLVHDRGEANEFLS